MGEARLPSPDYTCCWKGCNELADERTDQGGHQVYDGMFCGQHGQEVHAYDNHGWHFTHFDGPRCLEDEREGDREAFVAFYADVVYEERTTPEAYPTPPRGRW